MDLVETTAAPTWPPDAVHVEHFAADPTALAGPRGSFVVKLARHGGEFTIPEGRSIIEVLAENGVAVETSCEQGSAGPASPACWKGARPSRRVLHRRREARERPDDGCVSRAKTRGWCSTSDRREAHRRRNRRRHATCG
jgi:vanillate O-demethylase ferredoxin subunit